MNVKQLFVTVEELGGGRYAVEQTKAAPGWTETEREALSSMRIGDTVITVTWGSGQLAGAERRKVIRQVVECLYEQLPGDMQDVLARLYIC